MKNKIACVIVLFAILYISDGFMFKRQEDKTKCPKVKAMRNFQLKEVNVCSFTKFIFASRTMMSLFINLHTLYDKIAKYLIVKIMILASRSMVCYPILCQF